MLRAPPASVDVVANRLFVNPPSDAAWHLGAFRMQAECRSAGGKMGGDFYAFHVRGPKRLAVVIGDACGRGPEGARLLPGVLASVEQLAMRSKRPSQFLQALNRLLVLELASDRFVTGAAFEIDAQAGTLTVANAAHVPAMLRRASGEVTIIGRASGPPLGILEDSSYFDETYHFRRGDVMVLMTDGIVEAVETDLTEMPKLTALVAQTRGGGGAVHRGVLSQLQAPQDDDDDMTLLSLELLGDAGSMGFSDIQRTT
jgi:serine phosphatase RsbU (regulator of sigma subunit)